MKYTRKACDVAGYQFQADVYHGECLPLWLPASEDTEAALDTLAWDMGIDRHTEWTYDSEDFPKVVFDSMIEEPVYCGGCGHEL